jgi:hypothetical protein
MCSTGVLESWSDGVMEKTLKNGNDGWLDY